MTFNLHSEFETHAFLSPSKNSWVNYDEDKLARVWTAAQAAARGDRLHDLAARLIRDKVRVTKNTQTFNMYVNDAIGYRMTPEQPLYFSEYCFGTADAIAFEKMYLRIHDLKTGVTPAKVRQLEVYAALFCLEYGYRPFDIGMEFRIYQNDDIQIYDGDPDEVFRIMEKAIAYTKFLRQLEKETQPW